jgi:hypothetical protein
MRSTPRSSRSSATLVEAQLRDSRLLTAAFAGAHLAAATPLFFLSLPDGIIVLWVAALSLSLGSRLRRKPVTSIRLLADGQWRLTLPDSEVDADLVHWYAHPWLCVAVFRTGWRFRRAVVVPYWVVEPDVHRRLRVALRSS